MKHSIGAVAKIVGVSIETIRAWERRYAMVSPDRDAAGIRSYARADIERLALARAAIELGHPVRAVASMSNEQLCVLSGRAAESSADEHVSATVVERVLQAISRYDVEEAESILQTAMLVLAFDDLFIEVLAPLMRGVGTMWANGAFSVAQEHLASCLVRNIVGNVARFRRSRRTTRMIFATPPDELHEFGIAFAACLASGQGARTYVLGPSVPVVDVVSAARATNADVIVIGCTRDGLEIELRSFLSDLDEHLPAGTAIWVGGRALEYLDTERWPSRARSVSTLRQFVQRSKSLR